MENKIDHEYTRNITCPYCGCEYPHSSEIEPESDGDLGMLECQQCYLCFKAERHVWIQYSTYPMESKK